MMADELNTPIEIDLGATRSGELNESFLVMFGTAVKMILQRMFGGHTPEIKIKGRRSEVDSFAKVLDKEKRYMKSFKKHGLDDNRTYASKYRLDGAVEKFEKETGLKWPFK